MHSNNKVTYFDSFGVEPARKEIKKFIGNKNIKGSSIITNSFIIQAYDSVMCGYFCIGFIDFMLKNKSLADFTYLFSPNNSKKHDDIILNYFKKVKCNSIKAPNIYPNLNDQQQFSLNKINEGKDYFIAEIRERELMSKRLSKYVVPFNYFDKSLIVLSATSGSISIVSFATVIGTPVGIASASFSLAFSMSTGIVKILLKTKRNKKNNHNCVNCCNMQKSKLLC